MNDNTFEKKKKLHQEMQQAQKEIKEQAKDVDRYRERKINLGKEDKYRK